MKKIILAAFTLLLFSQANALTLDDCSRYSDGDIAKMLMNSIALGGQIGMGNAQCMNAAKALDVSTIDEELSEANVVVIESGNDIRIVRIDPASEDNMFRPVVHYVVRKRNGSPIAGEFSFKRHTNFLDPESINSLKCASISNPPSTMFMLSSCR